MADLVKGVSGAAAGAKIGTMIFPGVGTAVAGVLGGVLGMFAGRGDRKKAEALMQEAYQEIMAIGAPPDMTKAILLEKFQQAGMYTPELEQQIDMVESEVGQITEDPGLRESQMGALDILSDRADAGLTAEDRAAFNQVRGDLATANQGTEMAILQNMQQRGQGGSGAELAARLSGTQSNANNAAREGDAIAATASRNALDSARMMGDLSGSIRNQDFSNENTIANAKDARNQMLYNNSVSLQQRNVDRAQDSSDQNINRRQAVSDANIGQANDESRRQDAGRLINHNSAVDYAQMRADASITRAGQSAKKAQDSSTRMNDIVASAGTGFDALTKAGIFDGNDDDENPLEVTESSEKLTKRRIS